MTDRVRSEDLLPLRPFHSLAELGDAAALPPSSDDENWPNSSDSVAYASPKLKARRTRPTQPDSDSPELGSDLWAIAEIRAALNGLPKELAKKILEYVLATEPDGAWTK